MTAPPSIFCNQVHVFHFEFRPVSNKKSMKHKVREFCIYSVHKDRVLTNGLISPFCSRKILPGIYYFKRILPEEVKRSLGSATVHSNILPMEFTKSNRD